MQLAWRRRYSRAPCYPICYRLPRKAARLTMKISRWIVRVVLAATAQSILPSLAITQLGAPPNPEMAQTCPGLVAGNYPTVIPAAWQVSGSLMGAPKLGELNSGAFNLAAPNSDQVRLTFLGHATFLIDALPPITTVTLSRRCCRILSP
jgi:hypothetical protein